ncbi:hypothetical protein OE749_06645 [Aestuariibacter sp. AA17]|uniref:Uncharacterized protein n=1 Tax=Fluctibacter corallii TaxID=2984329 RepID=A0ABT3A6Q2_9ALTE|nr:hypothetical protein [Aestuariibacter sp. AA17]MCV2884369.1 hypothetical protein [Aestuariibacter sp. AA17]
MNRVSKGLVTTCFSAFLVAGIYAMVPTSQTYPFCTAHNPVEFDKSLPISHPHNVCALQTEHSVSWVSWISGSTTQSGFHYLDLLELLTRGVEDASKRG